MECRDDGFDAPAFAFLAGMLHIHTVAALGLRIETWGTRKDEIQRFWLRQNDEQKTK
jgi:hypothetical protein